MVYTVRDEKYDSLCIIAGDVMSQEGGMGGYQRQSFMSPEILSSMQGHVMDNSAYSAGANMGNNMHP